MGHFGPEKGPKLVQKWLQLLTIRPQNGLKFVPNGPQNNFQTTPTVLNSCGQYYFTLFGGKQVIFVSRKGGNQPKTLNLDDLHSMVFPLRTAITWLNFAQFHLLVPVLKTTKQGKHS